MIDPFNKNPFNNYLIITRQHNFRLVKIESNPLTNVKILDQSKLKAFADDKINVAAKQKFVLRWVEIMGGEAAGYQYFLLFFFFKQLRSQGH